jgi:O-antigen ligase
VSSSTATIAAASVRSGQANALAKFDAPAFSVPIHPGHALGWALVALGIANLGRIPVFSTGDRDAAIVLNDVFVAGLASFCVIAAVLRRSLWLDRVAIWALAFAAVGFFSAIISAPQYGLSAAQLLIALSYLARWLVYFGVYLFVINNVRVDQIPGIWSVFVKVMLAFAIFGIFQSFFLPDFAQLVYPDSRASDWDAQGHRLVTTVLDPNLAASMILLVLLVQLAQIACGAKVAWWQPATFLLALTLTLSRSGLLAFVAGVIVILFARGISLRLLRLFGIILFFSTALVPRLISLLQAYARFDVGAGSSAGTRVFAWLVAFETIARHPVIGVGFNTYGYVKNDMGIELSGASAYGSDGGLIFATVMTGLVGLCFYVCMLAAVFARCRRLWRRLDLNAEQRGLAIGVAAGIVALCVHSLFANSLFTTFVMEMMWVLWGLTFVLAKGAGTERRGA